MKTIHNIGDAVQWPSRHYGLVRGRISHISRNGLEVRISVTDKNGAETQAYIVRSLELQPDSSARLRRLIQGRTHK